MTDSFQQTRSLEPCTTNMYKTILNKAIETVPGYGDRISLFTKKLRLAQYADGSIYDYRLKISQAVLFHNKLPDYFTQTDIEVYLSMLMDQQRCSLSYFNLNMIFSFCREINGEKKIFA